jgi:hypothetical protein
VYDARVGGIEREVARPVECQGDACQHPVTAPEDPTPGSLTYQGQGSPLLSTPPGPAVKPKAKPETRAQKLAAALKVCRRKHGKAPRGACERQAHKQFGPVKRRK